MSTINSMLMTDYKWQHFVLGYKSINVDSKYHYQCQFICVDNISFDMSPLRRNSVDYWTFRGNILSPLIINLFVMIYAFLGSLNVARRGGLNNPQGYEGG